MKIIAFYEPNWFDSEATEWRMWDHLCRAYEVELQMIHIWNEVSNGEYICPLSSICPNDWKCCKMWEGIPELREIAEEGVTVCPNMGENGCILPREERPVTCRKYICNEGWEEYKTTNPTVYLMDQYGKISLDDHKPDSNGIYVFGRTHLDLTKHLPHYAENSIRIDTPNSISLFGVTAAAIFLDRSIK